MFDTDANSLTAYGASAVERCLDDVERAQLHRNARGWLTTTRGIRTVRWRRRRSSSRSTVRACRCRRRPAIRFMAMARSITCSSLLRTSIRGPIRRRSGAGHSTSPLPEYLDQVQAGMLSCDSGHGFRNVTDGASNTVLIFEDAGRSHPAVAKIGAYSSRPSPVSNPVDPVEGKSRGGSPFSNGRRVWAWADPDTVTNGFSGPSNAVMPQSNRNAQGQQLLQPIWRSGNLPVGPE